MRNCGGAFRQLEKTRTKQAAVIRNFLFIFSSSILDSTSSWEIEWWIEIQILQPLDAEKKAVGIPIACIDTVGAGPGEVVFYVTAYEAVIPYSMTELVPIDASIIGIVEHLNWTPASGDNV